MAIAVKWNTVSDAEVQQSLAGNSRLVRTAFVTGIDSTVVTSKLALLQALEHATVGAPALGDEFDPVYPSYICIHRVIRGVPNSGGQMARIWCHYETAGGGGTPLERFAAEDVTTLMAEPTEVFPGTATQIRCSLTDASPLYTSDTPPATDRPITVNYPRVMRALILYGLFSESPPNAVRLAANKVNDAFWQGLPIGYWRCEGARARYSSATGMYEVSVGFLNKGEDPGDDWSTYAIARDDRGELAKVPNDVLNTLYGQSYHYGPPDGNPQGGVSGSDKNGIFKAGFYRTANFSALFGDEFPIGD